MGFGKRQEVVCYVGVWGMESSASLEGEREHHLLRLRLLAEQLCITLTEGS